MPVFVVEAKKLESHPALWYVELPAAAARRGVVSHRTGTLAEV